MNTEYLGRWVSTANSSPQPWRTYAYDVGYTTYDRWRAPELVYRPDEPFVDLWEKKLSYSTWVADSIQKSPKLPDSYPKGDIADLMGLKVEEK